MSRYHHPSSQSAADQLTDICRQTHVLRFSAKQAASSIHHPQVFWVCEATMSQYLKSTADPDMRDMENISMQMISWLSLMVTIVRCIV